MKYSEVKSLHLPTIDQEVLAFWSKENIFRRSVEERKNFPHFVFYEGPPSANGLPGIHHVLSRTLKDTFCRFKTLQGYLVNRKGGWDTHGLPIELGVEKRLGITKEDIGKTITIAEYNAICRKSVMEFKDIWDDITVKMGYWVDLDNPYITFDNSYIETVWYLLKRLYDKGLLYKGYTIQPYSPAAGTGLSSHELNQPGAYHEITDNTVTAMFKVVRNETSSFLFDDEQEDVRILAWTTTPWTLPSNTGLTVGAKIEYVKIQTFSPYTGVAITVILADKLVAKWFKAEGETAEMSFNIGDKLLPWRKVATFSGAELANVRYEQLLPFGNEIEELDGKTDAFRVILGDFVTTEDGTGVVHTAPSFGADDRKAAKAAGLGTLTLVDKQGRFLDTVGAFSGRYVKDYRSEGENYRSPDIDIIIQLKTENKAFNAQKYAHNYPHCWRTDKPILYYPLDSWFIRSTALKERMTELNQTINWKPASTGEGRFGNWLQNLQDWNLSRSRYWGIPLPIWRTADGTAEKCIGSLPELADEIAKANAAFGLNQILPEDLHRPHCDDIQLVSESGQPMKRETDLIDVWFDSGSMPYAQWGLDYEKLKAGHDKPFKSPFEENEIADFIAEGVDQTRGWFFTLHAIATMCFDGVAYKNVISTGLLLDEKGEKMSKSKGNVVDPFKAIGMYGADAVRWYMLGNSDPWDNLKFSWRKTDEQGNPIPEHSPGIEEVQRKFFGTLFNTYSFFSLYANIDKFEMDNGAATSIASRPVIDRWILSKLNSLLDDVTAFYRDYEPTKAVRAIEDFVDRHLSNWYVRLCRRRFWRGEMTDDKRAAYETLYECLSVVAQLMSPVAPFFAEWLYRNLHTQNTGKEAVSVHLSLLPTANKDLIDPALEERMEYAQGISSLVLSLRKRERIRVRQPLGRMLLPVLNADFREQVDLVKELILQEVNVKAIEYITDTAGVVEKSIKPNFRILGKKVGKNMKAAGEAIAMLSQSDITTFEKMGEYEISLEGAPFKLVLEDVEIISKDIPGWLVANDNHLTVALDVTLTDDLVAEGTARELINRIQNLRKQRDYVVTDRIHITIEPHPLVKTAAEKFTHYICEETLATSLTLGEAAAGESIDLTEDAKIMLDIALN